MRSFLEKALIRNSSKEFLRVNTLLGFVTIISIVSISLETVESLRKYEYIFQLVEYIVVGIFTVEYLGRAYVKEDRIKYIFSFFGIVDIISILPTYFGLANLTFLKSARIFRVLQFLRTLRLAKLAKINKFSNKNSRKSREVQFLSLRIYGITLFGAVVIFGTLLYLIESSNPLFKDIPTSSFWALQAILGGNTNTSDFSLAAKTLVIFIQFSGLLLFGLLIHLVGKFIERKLLGSESIID